MLTQCTCGCEYAASWHDETCPRFANKCDWCEGEGGRYVRLGCGCCSDWEFCDECNGTGDAKYTVEV